MPLAQPSFTVGIEEEYLLADRATLDLAAAPEPLMRECEAALADQVSPEFLRCQIEVGTRVCENLAEARADLVRLRSTIAAVAEHHGLVPLACSTHPFADWEAQQPTPKARYQSLLKDLAGVGRRMLICGLHVHVGIEDPDLRIDLFNQVTYFLPHILALSTSSPFFLGRLTGLKSYRLSIFDNLPRTGLPPSFASHAHYQRTVDTLIRTGIIEDATKIWWDLRPSARFPTLEMRICDIPTRLEDSMTIAALFLTTTRMLYRMRRENLQWRQYDRFLINENRWRAQRYGMSEGLIDFGRGALVPYPQLLEELLALVRSDAEALGCLAEVEAARSIVARGTSADQQEALYHARRAEGADQAEALKAVVAAIAEETVGEEAVGIRQ